MGSKYDFDSLVQNLAPATSLEICGGVYDFKLKSTHLVIESIISTIDIRANNL